METPEELGIEDTSLLTDADWAETNKLGGKKHQILGPNDVADRLNRDRLLKYLITPTFE